MIKCLLHFKVTLTFTSACNNCQDTVYQSGWSIKDAKIQPWLQLPRFQILLQGQSRPSLVVKCKASQGYHHQTTTTFGMKYRIWSCHRGYSIRIPVTCCATRTQTHMYAHGATHRITTAGFVFILIPTWHVRMLCPWLRTCKMFNNTQFTTYIAL